MARGQPRASRPYRAARGQTKQPRGRRERLKRGGATLDAARARTEVRVIPDLLHGRDEHLKRDTEFPVLRGNRARRSRPDPPVRIDKSCREPSGASRIADSCKHSALPRLARATVNRCCRLIEAATNRGPARLPLAVEIGHFESRPETVPGMSGSPPSSLPLNASSSRPEGVTPLKAQSRGKTWPLWSGSECCLFVVGGIWLRTRHASSAVSNDVVVCDGSV